MNNALLVKAGQISKIELPGAEDDWRKMQEIIGNIFTTCFKVPGVGPDTSIYGFCDDEGLLVDEPDWNVVPDFTLRTVDEPIAGPILIVGGDESTGDNRSLLDVEMDMFSIDTSSAYVMMTPHGVRVLHNLRFQRLAE